MWQDLAPSQPPPLSVSLRTGFPLGTGWGQSEERPLSLLTTVQQHMEVGGASLEAVAYKCRLGTRQQGLGTRDEGKGRRAREAGLKPSKNAVSDPLSISLWSE